MSVTAQFLTGVRSVIANAVESYIFFYNLFSTMLFHSRYVNACLRNYLHKPEHQRVDDSNTIKSLSRLSVYLFLIFCQFSFDPCILTNVNGIYSAK